MRVVRAARYPNVASGSQYARAAHLGDVAGHGHVLAAGEVVIAEPVGRPRATAAISSRPASRSQRPCARGSRVTTGVTMPRRTRTFGYWPASATRSAVHAADPSRNARGSWNLPATMSANHGGHVDLERARRRVPSITALVTSDAGSASRSASDCLVVGQVEELGVDDARIHDVDAARRAPEVDRHRLRERRQRGLGGAVGRLAGRAEPSCDRRHVHDVAAAALEQARQQRQREPDRREVVDRHHRVDLVDRERAHVAPLGDARRC